MNARKSYGILIALILLSFLLPGCTNPQSSNELKEEILSRCTPLALDWMQENEPEAEDVTAELYDISWGEVSYDVIRGTYKKEGTSYIYYLNVDTGEYCSEEYYGKLHSYIDEEISSLLTFDYRRLEYVLPEAIIHGTVVSDQDFNWKRDELKQYDISKSAYHSYARFTEEKLPDEACSVLGQDDFEITVSVKEPRELLTSPILYSFLKEHENWVLVIVSEDDSVLDTRVRHFGSDYEIARAFRDKQEGIQYELYQIPDNLDYVK